MACCELSCEQQFRLDLQTLFIKRQSVLFCANCQPKQNACCLVCLLFMLPAVHVA